MKTFADQFIFFILPSLWILIELILRGSLGSIVVSILDIVLSEFEPMSRSYNHFRTNSFNTIDTWKDKTYNEINKNENK